jgi:iron complex outermembrane receptor protein
MNLNSVRNSQAALALILGAALFAVSGNAQTAAPQAQTEETTVKMEKFVVTGSNIPDAAAALSIPINIVSTDIMAESGINANMLDVLRKVAPNISGIGQENAQIATGSNFGGASLTLKGLPTLVLINGRRVASDPAESQGGYQFVDMNLVPPAAVDRIEVLQDGASAVYGSDAVGGVINIILKNHYNGWETGAHYGYSPNTGHYSERSAYLVGGVSNDKTSITISMDYGQHDAMYLSDRPYTNPIYGTYTFPGSLEVYNNITGDDLFYQLAPGKTAPPGGGTYTIAQLVANGTYIPETTDAQFQTFNLARGETMSSYLKRYSAMVNVEHKVFGDKLVGFADMIASHTNTWSQLNAQPVVPYLQDPWIDINVMGFSSSPPPAGTTYIPVTAAANPFSQSFVDMGQTTPESHPGYGDGGGYEILPRARFVAYPRLYQNDGTLYRAVGGLRGDINEDLHWEAAANLNRYNLYYTNPGLINTTALQAALASGQINPFATTQSASAFTGVVGTAFVNMLSTLSSFDFKFDGTPFELPAGKLGFALGGGYVREVLSAVPDVNSLPNSTGTTQGWSNATTFQEFNAKRNFVSWFAELNVPITSAKQNIPGAHAISIDAAVRNDDYSGKVGSSTEPQVTLSWAPLDDQFKFRGSAGKSFLAPPLYSLYGPVSAGSTVNIKYNKFTGGTGQAQFNQTGGSNPELKPETANSWTAGFVYTPKAVDGLSITVDYSDITMKQIFGNVPAATVIQSVETLGTASPYVGLVHYNNSTGPNPSAPGGISSHSPQSIYVVLNTTNLSGTKVGSTDITLDYVQKVAGLGKFDLTSTWALYNTYKLELIPSEPYYQYAGTATVNEGTVPKWRTYTTFSWSNKGAGAFIGYTCVASVIDLGTGGDNQSDFGKVGTFTSFDVGLSYDFKDVHLNKWLDGLKVTIGANNVFNKYPPLAVSAFPDTNADTGTYNGAIGRMVYINATYKF